MQDIDFYLGYPLQLVPPPSNWKEMQVELSFENLTPDAVLNSSKPIWKGKVCKIINAWAQTNGIFEGIPFRMQICNTNIIVFDGILDLTDPDTVWNCDIIEAPIRDKREDMFNALLPSVSFAYLANPSSNGGPQNGPIIIPEIYPAGDFIPFAYQVNSIPDYIAVMTSLISIVEIIMIIEKLINEIVGLIASIAGAGVVLGVGGLVVAIIECVFWLVEIIVLVLVVIDLLEMMYQNLVAPVYSKLGMNVWTIFQRICNFFGFGFSSTISTDPNYSDLCWMPIKNAWSYNAVDTNISISDIFSAFSGGISANRDTYDDLYNFNNNGFAYGYPDEDPLTWVGIIETMFNAKCKIILDNSGNPILHFERWDWQYILSTYKLPNISDDAPFKQSYQTNASELAANYQVIWAQDSNDYNTYNIYNGTTCFCNTSVQQIIVTQSHVTLQNFINKNISAAQGTYKQVNTVPEMLVEAIYPIASSIANGVIGTVNTFIAGINGVIDGINWVLSLANVSLPSVGYLKYLPSSITIPAHLMLLSGNTTGAPKLIRINMGIKITSPAGRFAGYCIDSRTRAVGDMLSSNIQPQQNGISVPNENGDPLSAQNLMKYFHFSSLPYILKTPPLPYSMPYSPNSPYANQYYTYKSQKIPLCCEDFITLQNNNIIYDYNGNVGRADSIKWTMLHSTAIIDYRIMKLYDKNLQTLFIIDGVTGSQAL